MSGVTLKDARRVALAAPFSPHSRYARDLPPNRWWILVDALRPLGYTAENVPVQADIDRLIAVHGPRALLKDVIARPCAEDAQIGGSPMSSQDGGALDHNHNDEGSDEKTDAAREDKAPQKGQDDDEQVTASGPSPSGASEDGNEPRPEDHGGEERAEPAPGAQVESAAPPQGGCPTGNGDRSATELSQRGVGEVTENPGGSPGTADAPECDAPGGAGADPEHQEKTMDAACSEGRPVAELRDATPGEDGADVELSSTAPGEGEDDGGEESPLLPGAVKGTSRGVPVVWFGGDFGLSEAERKCTKGVQRSAREVERALLRLISKYDVGLGEPSPRIDGRRLAAELVSRRYQISRAARREQEPALVILAADVSGSCSAAAPATQLAAVAVARQFPSVLVVWHSNGHVVECLGSAAGRVPAAMMARRDWGHGDFGGPRLAELVRALRCPVAAVVAWGDWDAGAEYQALCEAGADLYWLDSYAACSGAKPAARNLRTSAASWRQQPAGWWQGVNDAARSAIALRVMCQAKTGHPRHSR